MQEVVQAIKDKHDAALRDLGAATGKVASAADLKKLVDEGIKKSMKELGDSCREIMRVCKGFNLVAEMSITLQQLESEARLIRNTKARSVQDDIIRAVKAMIDAFEKIPPSGAAKS